MSAILATLAAAFGGIFTGVGMETIKQLLGGIGGWIKRRQEFKQALAMREMDLKYLNAETDAKVQIAREETRGRIEEGELAAFSESMRSDRATYSPGTDSALLRVVDFIRGITRPFLTGYLVVLVTLIYLRLMAFIGDGGVVFDQAQSYELARYVILSVIYMANVAVGWWFASRPPKETAPRLPQAA